MFKYLRRIPLIFFSLVISIIILEFTLQFISSIGYKHGFLNKDYLQEKLQSLTETQVLSAVQDDWTSRMHGDVYSDILHPYLGFVRKPGIVYPRNNETVNEFGFLGQNPLESKSENQVNIAILGGSVAEGLYMNRDLLLESLNKKNTLTGKKIIFFGLGLGGYKQPQQLLAINYLLSIGVKFDIVINLDGFNDVSLVYSENWKNDIYPFYPRHWELYSQQGLSMDDVLEFNEMAKFKVKRQRLANFIFNTKLNNSIIVLNIWNILDNNLSRSVNYQDGILASKLSSNETPQVKGPLIKKMSRSVLFDEAAKVWSNSSLQISYLAKANKFLYFHFLQPNQYVPDSKTFNDKERQAALLKDDQTWSEPVIFGYPKLIEEGKKLKNMGVNFFDLTNVYSDEKATVYMDNCCHYNRLGYAILINEIVDRIKPFIRN